MSARDGRPALALSLRATPRADSPSWARATVDRLVERGRATAAAALVSRAGAVVAYAESGDARRRGTRAQPLFDVASLTKLWTASLALRLDARGLLPLGLEIGEVWPVCDRRLAKRTLEDLLRHRAGLQPWAPLHGRCRNRREVAELLLGGELLGARRGTYGDLDYVLWGLSAARRLGRPLAELLADELVRPLGLEPGKRPRGGTFFVPCRLDNRREVALAAAQEVEIPRKGPPARGRVQDGNARFLGAPAGHAGLFGSAWAMLTLAREWLVPGALWPAEAVERALAGPGTCALGWRRPTRRGSAGPALGPGSFGHVGFTGGSIWVDPGRECILILMAHRKKVEVDLPADRRRFHRLAIAGSGS